jgi:hypothetical protein
MSVNNLQICLVRNVKTLLILSSYTWRLTSTILRCCDISADISNGLQFSLISTLYFGPCSKCNDFGKINPQTTIILRSSFYAMQHFHLKLYTFEYSWRVSFSSTGQSLRRQAKALKSAGSHQYSLRSKDFKLLKLEQNFKSLLKIN